MRDERTPKDVCGEARVEIYQEDWGPMRRCACFGGDPISFQYIWEDRQKKKQLRSDVKEAAHLKTEKDLD